MPHATILIGNAVDQLKRMPRGIARCCVTSPPYWDLRDYEGEQEQLGNEPHPAAYIRNLLAVFREVRDVLTDDGTLWVNLGDTYAKAPIRDMGVKKKDLIGIPHWFAFAMRKDGWHYHADNVWDKLNPMSESAGHRSHRQHEMVFQFSKGPRPFFDYVAVRADTPADSKHRKVGHGHSLRSVWRISLKSYKGAHFAVFPPQLPEIPILAGTSAHGRCPKCWKPWERVVEKERIATRPGRSTKVASKSNLATAAEVMPKWSSLHAGNRDPQRHVTRFKTLGWQATCECRAGDPLRDVVLDPFSGSGTTAFVATRMSRDFIGCELSDKYADMALARVAGEQDLFYTAGKELPEEWVHDRAA